MENFDIDRAADGECPAVCSQAITTEEVKSALKTISAHKATGIDDIPPALICDRSILLTNVLTAIFNDMLSTGTFPKSWKTDRPRPIHKGDTKTEVGNDRLVAILTIRVP